MTPDNLSFIWAFFAVAALIAALDLLDAVLRHRRRSHRTDVALSHDEYDQGVTRWDSLSTMQQLRDQTAQDQLNYGAPLHERPLDLEAESTSK